MEYSIKVLNEKYLADFSNRKIDINIPKTKLDISAYNDLEYLNLLKQISNEFQGVDELSKYEDFLKGE